MEIGGYFELDPGGSNTPLPDGVLLNSGRNALRHIVRMLGIRKIHIPYYVCPVVLTALREEGCEILPYCLDASMMPAEDFSPDDTILYVNYFGVCGKNVDVLAKTYPHLIVDCAQAYFASPKGEASFSSPRKFFGVPDGGIAYGVQAMDYPRDESSGRMAHLHARKERGARAGYALFRAAEDSLFGAPIRAMSPTTSQLLSKVDAAKAIRQRQRNFACLDAHLHSSFPVAMAADDVPMVYPFVTQDQTLRQRLIDHGIFVATYWPNLEADDSFCNTILPLPLDQRYEETDIQNILAVMHVLALQG